MTDELLAFLMDFILIPYRCVQFSKLVIPRQENLLARSSKPGRKYFLVVAIALRRAEAKVVTTALRLKMLAGGGTRAGLPLSNKVGQAPLPPGPRVSAGPLSGLPVRAGGRPALPFLWCLFKLGPSQACLAGVPV